MPRTSRHSTRHTPLRLGWWGGHRALDGLQQAVAGAAGVGLSMRGSSRHPHPEYVRHRSGNTSI